MNSEEKYKGGSSPPQASIGARNTKSPYEKGLVSRLFFMYMSFAMSLANERASQGTSLKEADVYTMPADQSADLIFERFWKNYEETKSVFKSQIYVMGYAVPAQIILLFLANLAQYAGPVALNLLLQFYTDLSMPNYYGYVISGVLMGILILRSLMFNHGIDYVNLSVTTTYASLYTALYKRLLHLIESSKGLIGAGRIINFFTTDSTLVAEMLTMVNNVWVAPLHLIVSVTLLYIMIQWVAFICVGMVIIIVILQSVIIGAFIRNRFRNQQQTDKRTKLLQEFMEGIRIVKYYAWEQFARSRISEVRRKEIREMATALYLRALYEFAAVILPVFTMLIVFAVYSSTVGELSVSKVFTVISVFRILQTPIWTFISAVVFLAQSKASMTRIQKFFELTKTSQDLKTGQSDQYPVGKIEIVNGSFAWETSQTKEAIEMFNSTLTSKFGPAKKADEGQSESKVEEEKEDPYKDELDVQKEEPGKTHVILKGIDIVLEPKEIVAVVGLVGAGKSSLVNAMIGEMITLEGRVNYNGSIAYIAQNAWIMNGTIKENIIMNKPYDKEKYERTLTLCELDSDLLTFPKGDLTEIGSKGINLSGGQKQRVAIARAVYSDSDIYIIDDCLSALDPHVGKCIFRNVIMGLLADKTRVFVTHGMSYLKSFKDIVVMRKGRIIARGPYDELQQNCKEFKHLTLLDQEKRKGAKQAEMPVKGEEVEKTKEELEKDKKEREAKNLAKDPDAGKLTEDEKQESGRVQWKNFILLFKYSGVLITTVCLLAFSAEQAGIIVIDWWVGIWSTGKYDKSDGYYLGVYAGLSVAQSAVVVIRGILYVVFIMCLARNTQMSLVWSILRAPLQWFDKTPVGRIMNRTCKDQSNIDNELVWQLQGCVRMALLLIGSFVLVGIVTYYFFAILGVAIFLYVYYYSYYIQAARDSRRIESMAQSPIFVQYEETLDGLSTIRAYKYQDMFITRIIKKVNHCMDAYFMNTKCVRWVNFRIEVLSSLVVAGAFFLAVWERNAETGKDSNMIGLSLSQSLNVVFTIGMFLDFYGMLDTRMNSIERIFEYIRYNPKERDFEEPKPADPEWPKKGEIELKDLYLRYRRNLPFVIKGLNLKIGSKEKVGVAGRTGSGKSTLTLGLLRIMEPVDPSKDMPEGQPSSVAQNTEIAPEPKKGAIMIDGQDVTQIGLHILRRNIAIIPQDPVLFSGTIRSNLDPLTEATAERSQEMISVLAKVKLFEKIWINLCESQEEGKKDTHISPKKPEGLANREEEKMHSERKLIKDKVREDPENGPVPFVAVEPNASVASQRVAVPDPDHLTQKQIEDVLNYEVQERGSNFSVGERQLLCIARAILRKPKILLMDEATASIDEATDQHIQTMIKTEFNDATVITIAHRVKTIIQYDKILVLKDGEKMEFGPPEELLKNDDGMFREMVSKNGKSALEDMMQLAMARNNQV